MKVHIQWQTNWGHWRHFQTKHNERDAYRVAANRASSTGKRHRLKSENGDLLDIIHP